MGAGGWQGFVKLRHVREPCLELPVIVDAGFQHHGQDVFVVKQQHDSVYLPIAGESTLYELHVVPPEAANKSKHTQIFHVITILQHNDVAAVVCVGMKRIHRKTLRLAVGFIDATEFALYEVDNVKRQGPHRLQQVEAPLTLDDSHVYHLPCHFLYCG